MKSTGLNSWPWDASDSNHAGPKDSFQRVALSLAANRKPGTPYGVMLSAAHQGQGASTAAIAIARELQRSLGLRPLLAELNRRNPCFAERLELDSQRTVEKLLTGSGPLMECVQVDRFGLSVLPAGGDWGGNTVANAACRILLGAEDHFDLVVFDTPPLLECADTLAAGSSVEDLVVVVHAGKTSADVLARIKQQTDLAGIRIAGSILTKQKAIVPRWLDRWLAS